MGTMVDAVYYNRLIGMNNAVTHSGDNKTGEQSGDDEMIRIDLDAFPSNIQVIILVVNAHKGGTFEHVKTAKAEVRDIELVNELIGKTKQLEGVGIITREVLKYTFRVCYYLLLFLLLRMVRRLKIHVQTF